MKITQIEDIDINTISKSKGAYFKPDFTLWYRNSLTQQSGLISLWGSQLPTISQLCFQSFHQVPIAAEWPGKSFPVMSLEGTRDAQVKFIITGTCRKCGF
jgi:hypothetical protein